MSSSCLNGRLRLPGGEGFLVGATDLVRDGGSLPVVGNILDQYAFVEWMAVGESRSYIVRVLEHLPFRTVPFLTVVAQGTDASSEMERGEALDVFETLLKGH